MSYVFNVNLTVDLLLFFLSLHLYPSLLVRSVFFSVLVSGTVPYSFTHIDKVTFISTYPLLQSIYPLTHVIQERIVVTTQEPLTLKFTLLHIVLLKKGSVVFL